MIHIIIDKGKQHFYSRHYMQKKKMFSLKLKQAILGIQKRNYIWEIFCVDAKYTCGNSIRNVYM